ncbi:diguanylate cyclase (GGDEF)-like protein [Paenibacillus shirakamiensis]|uniref:Diguanylate cyclase (GGDEF)-like protein n=1 Tax=Paenibacillus shirakamiensis TaxID=1265935 RepID=A0ABS4JNC3_9BACL|nr:diguanylate cyclase [Paenibacillus shirakamiensis]MBP2002511.1 diguanylate cyclase (GGDEF)-like protein [Paenibacillus shirakamiensis]
MSLRLRSIVAIVFAILIAILTGLLSWIIERESTEEVKKTIGGSLAETSYQMAEKLDYFMWSRAGEIQMLSKLDAFRSPDQPEDIRKLLDQLKTSFPVFTWSGFMDTKGNVLASTDGILTGMNLSERPVFTEAQKDLFIGDVHNAKLLASYIPHKQDEPLQFVDISTPVYAKNGKLVGVLAAHLSWEWSRQVEQSILKPLENRYKNIEIFIISKKDRTVLLGPSSMVGHPLNIPLVDEARAGQNSWELAKYPDGRSYLTGFAYGQGYENYAGLGWSILIREPEDIAFASATKLSHTILLTGTAAAVVFAIFGWFIAGWIARPLKRIALAADLLRSGEQVHIPIYRHIKDIEILSSSLQNLVHNLTRTEDQLGQMSILALHDKLTGLPNRIALGDHLSRSIREVHGHEETLTLLYIDLDGFKNVNDTWGHQTGDQLLQLVGQRMKECIRPQDFICRMGGDEFVIVLHTPAVHPILEARKITERLITTLNLPFSIDQALIHIGCSIGGAVYPLDDSDPLQVIRFADEALYASKKAGKNQATFTSELLP